MLCSFHYFQQLRTLTKTHRFERPENVDIAVQWKRIATTVTEMSK